jgi:hypothetical protein
MSQKLALEMLKSLGGRAKISQIREAADKADPLSNHQNIPADLWKLKSWGEVEFDIKTQEWFIPNFLPF